MPGRPHRDRVDLRDDITPTLLALEMMMTEVEGTPMPSSTPVRTIMTTTVVTLSPDQSVPEAADVLGGHRIGAAPVVDKSGAVVGLLRDDDLLVSEARIHVPTAIEFLGAELVWPPSAHRYKDELEKAAAATVSQIMTSDFATVGSDDNVETVATLMHENQLSHVPVVDNGILVGIVSRGDVIRYIAATT
jgi:CBS domain-containing protein